MEMSPETYVLFSALQFADNRTKGGLCTFNNQSVNSTECQETLDTLTSTIDDIVNGLQFVNSEFEREHWKFEMTSILTSLSICVDYVEQVEQDSDWHIFIRQFPPLNTDLLFDLIVHCGLEAAFIKVLECFNVEMRLHLVSKCVKYVTEAFTVRPDNGEVDPLFKSIVQYVFLHRRCVLCVMTQDRRSNIYQFASEIVHELVTFVANNANTEAMFSKYGGLATVFLLGLLNVVKLNLSKTLFTFDITAVNCNMANMHVRAANPGSETCTKKGERTADAPSTNAPTERNAQHIAASSQYQLFADKYHLSLDTLCHIFKLLFVADMEKEIDEIQSDNDITVDLNLIRKALANLMTIDAINSAILSELTWVTHNENLAQAASAKWHMSAILVSLMRKLHACYSSVPNETDWSVVNVDSDKADRHHVVQFLRHQLQLDLWSSVGNAEPISDETEFAKALVVTGEQLDGWQDVFKWLLVDCQRIHDAQWIQCLSSNVPELAREDNTRLLWARLVNCNQEKTLAVQLRELFISAYKLHDIASQNGLLNHVFQAKSHVGDIFEINETHVFAKLTVLMNRLVELQSNADVISDISTLALQCPEIVLFHLIKNAAQNCKQCDIIISFLRQLSALAEFESVGEGGRYIYKCINHVLQRSADFTDKQQKAFLYFVMKCVARPTVEEPWEATQGESCSRQSGAGAPPLLDFVWIWPHSISPQITSVIQNNDDVNMFYDDTFEFCLKAMATILRENEHQLLDPSKQHDTVLVALIVTICDLFVSWMREVCAETMCLLADCKAHLLAILSSICALFQRSFAARRVSFKPNHFHWLLVKLQGYPWYINGYVLPLVLNYFTYELTDKSYSDERKLDLTFYIPESATKTFNCEENDLFVVSQNVPNYDNHWLSVLKIVLLSDDYCATVCSGVKSNILSCDGQYALLLSALIETLPLCVDIEWSRTVTFLRAVCKQSSAEIKSSVCNSTLRAECSDSNSTTSGCMTSHLDPILLLYDVVFIVLESFQLDGVESHIVKCLMHSIYCASGYDPDPAQDSTDSQSCTKRACWSERDMQSAREYLVRACLLTRHVSESTQEQLSALLLHLAERCSQLATQSDHQKYAHWFKLVTNVLPDEIRDVLCKKYVKY